MSHLSCFIFLLVSNVVIYYSPLPLVPGAAEIVTPSPQGGSPDPDPDPDPVAGAGGHLDLDHGAGIAGRIVTGTETSARVAGKGVASEVW